MDSYDLSGKLLDSWREVMSKQIESASINKQYPKIHTYVTMDDMGRRRVIGCRVEGSDIILDVEGK